MRARSLNKKLFSSNGLFSALFFSNRPNTMDDLDRFIGFLLFRKFWTFVSKPKRSFYVAWRRIGDFTAYRRLRRLGYAEILAQQPLGTLPAEWADLLHLYELVRVRQPNVVVEFGSGCSTPIIAKRMAANQADADNPIAFHSMEQSEQWLDVTGSYLAALAQADVAHCHLHHVDCAAYDLEHLTDCFHPLIPDVVPNILYIDDNGGEGRFFPAANVDVIEALAPSDFMIVVDGRAKAVALLKASLKRKYRVVQNMIHFYTTFELIDDGPPRGPAGTPNFGGGRLETEISYLNCA